MGSLYSTIFQSNLKMMMNTFVMSALLIFAVSVGRVHGSEEDQKEYDEIMACFAKCESGELGADDTCIVLNLIPTCQQIKAHGLKDYTFQEFEAIKHMNDFQKTD